jgi:CDP-diacylglycerol--glycerol-3-phosphate 3-phosphatidyltransferase
VTTSSVGGPRRGSFGPSALATPANALTAARLLLAPVVIVLIVDRGAAWSTLLVWIAVAASDALDGWVARRQGSTSSGAFLDPLADKVLVLGALIALVAEGTFWWVPVALIAAREVVISAYRSYVGRRGVSVPARRWAKIKTIVQEVAVGFALLPFTSDDKWVATAVLWVAVVLTLVTGVQYLLDGRRSQQRAV